LIIGFHFPVAVSKFVIQTSKLVQHFDVAGISFDQRSQREHANLRPAGRYGRFLQSQGCLPMVRFFFQNSLQHFNRVFRVLFNFSLRLHNGYRRSRDIEKTFLCRLAFHYLSAPQ
jgi:hypothetical protein